MGAEAEIQQAFDAMLQAFHADDDVAYRAAFADRVMARAGAITGVFDGVPFTLADRKASLGFTHSTELESEVLLASEDSGLVLLRANRRRADASIKSKVVTVYHYTRTDGGWKCDLTTSVEVDQD